MQSELNAVWKVQTACAGFLNALFREVLCFDPQFHLPFLLLPCLIADSSLAVAITTSQIDPVTDSSFFSVQALSTPVRFLQSALNIFGKPDEARCAIFQEIKAAPLDPAVASMADWEKFERIMVVVNRDSHDPVAGWKATIPPLIGTWANIKDFGELDLSSNQIPTEHLDKLDLLLVQMAKMRKSIIQDLKSGNPAIDHLAEFAKALNDADRTMDEILLVCAGNGEFWQKDKSLQSLAHWMLTLAGPLKSANRLLRGLKAIEQHPIKDIFSQDLWREQMRFYAEMKIDIINDVPNDVFIRGDRLNLRVAILNLVKNALHFASKEASHASSKGRVTIHAFLEDGKVVIAVSDNGPGIPAHLLDKDADSHEPRLYRYGTTERKGGTGQGLADVRFSVKDADGSIEVNSIISHEIPAESQEPGTTFTIRFPARVSDGTWVDPDKAQPASPHKINPTLPAA